MSSAIILVFLIFMPIIALLGLTRVKTSAQASELNGVTSYVGDLYAWGNCTWWVSMRRSQINDPIPNSWGNAATWATRASADGYLVDDTPTPGSIMQISDADGGLGHVAFVESVEPDGTWNISEMNVLGLDIVDYKSESPSAAVNYNFIHDRAN